MNRKTYETEEPCLVCGTESVQRTYHHICTRRAHGVINEPWNRMPLDLEHHNEVHRIGLVAFAKKYPQVKRWLIENDWELCPVRKKWFHPEAKKIKRNRLYGLEA